MKGFYVTFLVLIVSSFFSQTPSWDWAINPVQQHNSYRLRNGITVDGFGNCFIMGDSHGTQSQPGLLNDSGAFIARFNKLGQFTWAKKVEGQPAAICADLSGNVYVGGNHYYYQLGSTSSVTAGAFLRKYDHAGNVLWEYKSENKYTNIAAITVGPSGRVFVTGSKADTMALGQFKLKGKHYLFTACFSSAGTVQWAKGGDVIPDTSNSYINGNQIAVDQYENVYTTYAYGTCPSYACANACFLKLDQNGNYLLHKKYSSYNGVCNGIAVETNGDVIASHCLSAWTSGGSYVLRRYKPDFSGFYWEKIVAAWQCQDRFIDSRPVFSGTSDLFVGGGAGWQCGALIQKVGFDADTIVTDSVEDIVLCQIDRLTGNYKKVWHIPGNSADKIVDLAGDKFGNIYAAGYFNGMYSSYTLNPDTLCFENHCVGSGHPKSQLFVAKLKVSNQDFTDDVGLKTNALSPAILSPNPTTGKLNFLGDDPAKFLEVKDILGKTVIHKTPVSGWEIDLGILSQGVYLVRVFTSEAVYSQKIIKEQ